MRNLPPISHADADGPPSPCVRNCCLDGDDICLGCGRSIAEILRWHQADGAERTQIVATANERLRQRRTRAGG